MHLSGKPRCYIPGGGRGRRYLPCPSDIHAGTVRVDVYRLAGGYSCKWHCAGQPDHGRGAGDAVCGVPADDHSGIFRQWSHQRQHCGADGISVLQQWKCNQSEL